MRIIRIPKGGGRFRVVYSPDRDECWRLAALVLVLMQAERRAAVRAGVEGRSPVTCALPHRGFPVTVCADLAGWFDSVRPEQIRAGLVAGGEDPGLADQVLYTGAPRQGLPTSPPACNLAAVPLDRLVLDGLPHGAAYTRYADDMSVSLRHEDEVGAVLRLLEAAAQAMGWRVAPHKTHVQLARNGRRVLVGVSVGDEDIAAPRRTRRRLRAARHQDEFSRQARGLAEWCSLKLPRAARGEHAD